MPVSNYLFKVIERRVLLIVTIAKTNQEQSNKR